MIASFYKTSFIHTYIFKEISIHQSLLSGALLYIIMFFSDFKYIYRKLEICIHKECISSCTFKFKPDHTIFIFDGSIYYQCE